jgi:hypothetical protein
MQLLLLWRTTGAEASVGVGLQMLAACQRGGLLEAASSEAGGQTCLRLLLPVHS